MADDVRISVGLSGHHKTRKLKRQLGAEGCWSLVVLFLWTGSQRWDGTLYGMADDDIELAADWDGEPGVFVRALIAVGFLDGEPGLRAIHDWKEHNPYAASKGERIEKGKQAAAARWNGRKSRVVDATGMPAACQEHATTIAEQCPPAPTPTPTITPDRSQQADISPSVGTTAGRACKAMRLAGCIRVNPSNPNLLAALEEGVTVEALADTVREGIDAGRGDPFAWAIATARGRHREGARPIGGNARAGPSQSSGKTMQGLQILEDMKRGLASARSDDGVSEVALLGVGAAAGG